MKDRILIAIKDLEAEKNKPSESDSTNWLVMVDRGGLFHITDDTYDFFCCMEMLVRKTFDEDNVTNLTPKTKETLNSKILNDEEVTFLWYNLMEEVESEVADRPTLLRMVVQLYITIRGFTFAKTWVAQYKLANKEITQKSKSLRKTLESTSSTTEN